MPYISPSSKILVTGANGYVGMWVVHTLLAKGYFVRATVRTEEKGTYMKKYFAEHTEKLDTITLEDMLEEGAFDEAVKGVEEVIHSASPMPVNDFPDPNAYINPAVTVTRNVLNSVLRHGDSVKRVVYTSSVEAVITESVWREYTEQDWNDEALHIVHQEGFNAPKMTKYGASKVLAERAAWDIYNEHRGNISWDLVTLCPPLMVGPPIQDVNSISGLNGSLKLFHAYVLSPERETKEIEESLKSWADVRDVAEAHVRALQQGAAGGERILVVAGAAIWQDWIDIYAPGSGSPDVERVYKLWYDASKSKKLLGISYREKQETLHDTVKEFKERGWM